MKILTLIPMLLFILNCQSLTLQNSSLGKRSPSNLQFTQQELQTRKDDEQFAELLASLNLENSTITTTDDDKGKYFFEYKANASSVGIKVHLVEFKKDKLNLDQIGKWIPENESNLVEPQVFAYNLGRFLNMSELVVPATYYKMGPKGLSLFLPMLKCETENGLHQKNCIQIRNQLQKNPNSMLGAFIEHVKGEQEIADLTIINDSNINGVLNPNHPIAKFINAKEAMPSANKQMHLGVEFKIKDDNYIKAQNTELELAKQFSKIMVLDMLVGQWDRFSGGNIEAVYSKKKNTVSFMAIDNGGASMIGPTQPFYFNYVTRFDTNQIERVKKLIELLKADKAGTSAGLGITTNSANILERAEQLIVHVDKQISLYGANKVYFP